MSDRARSSVRTGTRDGSGTSDEVPEAAPATGATAVGAPAPAEDPHPVDATQSLTPAKAPAKAAPEPEAPAAAPAPPAAHPVTPLGPQTSTNRAVGDNARPVTSGPPVPPSPARAGAGTAVPPIDATQAVPLTAGARPVDPASRPSAVRAAEASGRTGKVRGASRGPRRARLQLRHIDTWSALKISLVLSIALFFVWMVAVGVLYGVLSGLGVFDTLNDLIGQLSTTSGTDAGSGGDVISAGIVFGGAAVIGAVNIVLLTALCTVTAFVYNLCSDLVGGLEVTLAERD
jgi:hypothetical protein